MAQRHVKACLITNPKSGRGGVDLSAALTILQANGWEVIVRQKLHGGAATDLAKDAIKEGCNVIVDCGGDGTLNEIVEGVAGTDAGVGTLPGGTANLWAHEMGISRDLSVAATQLVAAERRRVDVGNVTVNGKHHNNFVLMAGLGFDGAVIGNINKLLKNRIGPLAYAPAIAAAARSYHSAQIRVTMDNVNWHGQVSQVVVGNSRKYAGFTNITPEAYIDDGLLDICLITASGTLGLAGQLGSMLLRQRPNDGTSQTYRAASITIESPIVLPLQVDGGQVKLGEEDLTAAGVVYQFTLRPQGVTMLVPRTYAGTLFQPSRLADSLIGEPLKPVEAIVASMHPTKAAKRKHASKHGWRVQVLSIGSDSITGSRLKNGRVVRIFIDGNTVFQDGKDRTQMLGALSAINPGEEIHVGGRKGKEPRTFIAEVVQRGDAADLGKGGSNGKRALADVAH